MLDIKNIPILRFSPEDEKRLLDQRTAALVSQGRLARSLGWALSSCPDFVDEDMAINWRNGWRWEDQDIARAQERRKRQANDSASSGTRGVAGSQRGRASPPSGDIEGDDTDTG